MNRFINPITALFAFSVLFLLLGLRVEPRAQDCTGSGACTIEVQYQPSCIKNLSRVAHRLHVAPTTESSLLVATSCDNRQYDIVRLIEALLDRMDKVEKTK